MADFGKQHNTSVKYVLVSEDGKKYPPKYVVAVADHLANSADISTESFNSVDAKNYLESITRNTTSAKVSVRRKYFKDARHFSFMVDHRLIPDPPDSNDLKLRPCFKAAPQPDMVVFSSYAMQIIMAFTMLTMMFIMLPRVLVSARRINEVLDTEVAMKDGTFDRSDTKIRGLVEFRNVSFRYPDARGNVLEHISFTTQPGETVAIIGSTGSGKARWSI